MSARPDQPPGVPATFAPTARSTDAGLPGAAAPGAPAEPAPVQPAFPDWPDPPASAGRTSAFLDDGEEPPHAEPGARTAGTAAEAMTPRESDTPAGAGAPADSPEAGGPPHRPSAAATDAARAATLASDRHLPGDAPAGQVTTRAGANERSWALAAGLTAAASGDAAPAPASSGTPGRAGRAPGCPDAGAAQAPTPAGGEAGDTTAPVDADTRGPAPAGAAADGPAQDAGAGAGPGDAGGRTAAVPHPAAEPRVGGVRCAPPLDAQDRARLLAGAHHDPHALLGAHRADGGVTVRTLRPYAKSVTVLAEGLRAELRSEGDGLFAALLPLQPGQDALPDYELLVDYGTNQLRTADPYRFLPALGELDLHLISEGRHEQLWQALGARPMTHAGVRGTRFTVWAPNALGVRLAGDFSFWDGTALPMRSLGSSGVWELFVPGLGEGTLYKFEITRPDGSHTLRADPLARRTECPPDTASVVHSSAYEWQDADWLRRRAERTPHEEPMSVYEVHLPSWRPGLTYRELADQLPAYVKDLGFTHVELMPPAEHPFGGSWGYQITGYYAPTARLGSPDDFKFLIDALHRAGIGVFMDWVPAHFPKDDWALARFDGTPLYEHADPSRAEHPDWGTLEFDYGRREVRNFLVANAVFWCEEYHLDGLRVDAVASMLYLDYSREDGQWSPNEHGGRENLDAVAFLQEMNATLYRRCPGVLTIAEESTAWDGVTRATHHVGAGGFGGLGFGFKWNMGWMHDSLVYMSKDPVHRKYHHDEMTFSMVYAYSENYVLPISHDEVVHGKQALVAKMPGDWWQQRANHRAYLGFMWAHPGKQLLFMGQEFAQGAEWSEAHGPDWWLLDPAYGAEADHRGVRDLVRELNSVYARTPALWQRDTDPGGFAWIMSDAAEDNVFAFLRYDRDGRPLMAVSNFSPVVREDYRLGAPDGVTVWEEVLNTDALAYGGSGVRCGRPAATEPVPSHGREHSVSLTLPPLATLWLRPV